MPLGGADGQMLRVCVGGEPLEDGKDDGGAAGDIDIGGNGVAFDLLRGVRVKSTVFSTLPSNTHLQMLAFYHSVLQRRRDR